MRRWWWCGCLLGCGEIESVADYEEARAQAECEVLERCELGFWEAEYTGPEDCIRERKDRIEEDDDRLDDADCAYVPERAGECVDHVGGMSCFEWGSGRAERACDLVFDCTGGGR